MKPVPWDDQTTLSQTPICRTHPTTSTPSNPLLLLSRWMTLQPAGVSCAEGASCTPARGPEPRRKSAAVHRGNPALPGVPAQPGTICPGALTQRQCCQGGFPLTCCTLQAIWARPGPRDRSITSGVWTWYKRLGVHLCVFVCVCVCMTVDKQTVDKLKENTS